MRRRLPHALAASLAFTAGCLTADTLNGLALALPVALNIFLLFEVVKTIRVTRATLEMLKVVVPTLVLWALVVHVVLVVFVPRPVSCMPVLDEEPACPILSGVFGTGDAGGR